MQDQTQAQEMIQKLSHEVMSLKARIFDLSEESSAHAQQNQQLFVAFADALELTPEQATDARHYIDKINELKSNQIVVE